MKTTVFKGLHIRIENPAGSVRSGVDRVTGKPWSTKLTHDYGEIVGTNGVDDDPIDVFLGPNKSAPFVYVIHQLQKQTGEWDEDKCFLGFNDAMAAKAAYYKNYDHPELFYGDIETIPFDVFKQKVLTHTGDTMIHGAWDGISVTVGDPVTVDGMRGRGVVTEDNGSDVIVRFRNGDHIKRKKYNVHNLGSNTYHSKYMSAGEETVERENAPISVPHGTNKRIEKEGALFCVVSDGVDKNFGCYGNRDQANAVMNGKSFIEPDIPANMYASQAKCPACGSRKFALMPTDFETAKCRQCGKTWDMKAAGLQYTKSMAMPHPKPTMNIAKPKGHFPHPPKTLPKPPAVTSVKKFNAPHVIQAPKAPVHKAPMHKVIKAPKPVNKLSPRTKAIKLESFGDMGEPMAGALGHAHIEPEMWFHPPSERHPRRIPTDDVGEKDDRFLDVTKRKQAHEDRMKRLKRSTPGGLPPYIPAVTTLGASLLSSADKKKKLLDIIPRNTTLRVPHTVAYVPGVKAGRTHDKRMRRAFNAASI
jgi:hypothetical protein